MKLQQGSDMARETVVILGNGVVGQPGLDRLMSEFDWSLEKVATLEGLAARSRNPSMGDRLANPA
jgi:hypothetical protein